MGVAKSGEFGIMYRDNGISYAIGLSKEKHSILNTFIKGLFKDEVVSISKKHEVVLKSEVKEMK